MSINPQTVNDQILAHIGRRHTAEDFFRAYNIARESGIKYINTDLIAGLPGEGYASFSRSMDAMLKLRPENITVHTFCVKKAADIVRQDAGVYVRSSGDVEKSVNYSQVQATMAGYLPYYIYRQKNTVGNLENVGFALPGAEGLYNIYMMEEVHSIFAAGAGAVTKLVRFPENRIKRIFKPKYPYEYLALDFSEQANAERRREILEFFS
jgi:oxygen-independent coproporphyrinogen-3 oxidase